MKPFRNIRIIPIVLLAVGALGVLKIAGLLLEGGYVFSSQPQPAKMSWAQENLGFPGGTRYDPNDITGATPAKKEEPKKEEPPKADAPPVNNLAEPPKSVSASERALLERLQARRQELETRAREVDIRESLLKSAEKRIEGKVEELKGVETRITAAQEQKAAAESVKFKSIVVMYEGMKPKDAAKIFDRLDMAVLIEVASQIAPRKMSDILGLMTPEAAERLTVELARRAGGVERSASAAELPKIEGRPQPQNRN
ncbi:MAG: MotE family protein [Pseudomonadota bacterium]|jgi:flagellar motility protein MotE (MotC chaperone)